VYIGRLADWLADAMSRRTSRHIPLRSYALRDNVEPISIGAMPQVLLQQQQVCLPPVSMPTRCGWKCCSRTSSDKQRLNCLISHSVI